jgi:hypothetical protein
VASDAYPAREGVYPGLGVPGGHNLIYDDFSVTAGGSCSWRESTQEAEGSGSVAPSALADMRKSCGGGTRFARQCPAVTLTAPVVMQM